MFRKALWKAIDRLGERIDESRNDWRDKYWELRHDHDRLVTALGMTKKETHVVEYIKKDGPEQP